MLQAKVIEIPRAWRETNVKLLWRNTFSIRTPRLPTERATPAKDELTIEGYKPYEGTNCYDGRVTDPTSRGISLRIRDNKTM